MHTLRIQTGVDLAVHPAKDQMGKSGKNIPTWGVNKAEEQSVGQSPWTDIQ